MACRGSLGPSRVRVGTRRPSKERPKQKEWAIPRLCEVLFRICIWHNQALTLSAIAVIGYCCERPCWIFFFAVIGSCRERHCLATQRLELEVS